jgi:hypothetical protein
MAMSSLPGTPTNQNGKAEICHRRDRWLTRPGGPSLWRPLCLFRVGDAGTVLNGLDQEASRSILGGIPGRGNKLEFFTAVSVSEQEDVREPGKPRFSHLHFPSSSSAHGR